MTRQKNSRQEFWTPSAVRKPVKAADVPASPVKPSVAQVAPVAPPAPVAPKPAVDPDLILPRPPKALRMTANYSFYGDDGLFRAWQEGAKVTDPDEISNLTARGAPVERIFA